VSANRERRANDGSLIDPSDLFEEPYSFFSLINMEQTYRRMDR